MASRNVAAQLPPSYLDENGEVEKKTPTKLFYTCNKVNIFIFGRICKTGQYVMQLLLVLNMLMKRHLMSTHHEAPIIGDTYEDTIWWQLKAKLTEFINFQTC